MGQLAQIIARMMASQTGRNVATASAEYASARQASDNAPKVLAPSTLDRLQREAIDAGKRLNEAQKEHAKQIQENTRRMREGAIVGGAIGVGTAAAMRNDNTGMQVVGAGLASVGKAASMAGSALMMLGPVGMVVGGVVKAFGMVSQVVGQAVLAIDQLAKAILARADELMKYSPDIAVAKAQTTLKLQQADIREAQALGPDMARLLQAKTDVDISIRDILLPIKKVIVELVADFFTFIRDFLNEHREILIGMAVTIGEGIKIVVELLQFHFTKAIELFDGIPDKIANALKPKIEPTKSPWEMLRDEAMNELLPSASPNPAAPEHFLNIPAFQGL